MEKTAPVCLNRGKLSGQGIILFPIYSGEFPGEMGF
jgi:hypothetical protein